MNETNNDYSILFVEDNEVTLKNYTRILKEDFKNVYNATDGLSAYKVYQEKKPDILLIDVDLPKLNGLEFLKMVREKDQNTKAIVFTSYSDQKTLLNATSLKLTQYLIKPIKRKELIKALSLAIKELKSFDIIPKKLVILKDNFLWDMDKKRLFYNNKDITLTNKEREILSLIIQIKRNKEIITYEDIIYSLWDEYTESTLKSLKTLIYSLRKKLPKDTIENEYGIGYRLKIDE